MCPSCATDPPPVLIDDSLAILLNELALLSRQEVEDGFRGTAQAHTLRCDGDGAVDQDRMRHHGVEKLILSERRVGGVSRYSIYSARSRRCGSGRGCCARPQSGLW